MRNLPILLLTTLGLAIAQPVSGQSKYISDKSFGIGASGGYVAAHNRGVGSGAFGISVLGRIDVAVSYGKGTIEEEISNDRKARGTATTVTPAVTFYVAKATVEQPVNFGLFLSHAWVSLTDLKSGGRTHRRGEESHGFLFGGDVSAVLALSPDASILPGLSFVYAVVPEGHHAINHVTSPTIAASIAVRIRTQPAMAFVFEPGLIYRTQGDEPLAPAVTGGLIVNLFGRRA